MRATVRIDRLRVKNFRNLAEIDLPILPGAVIVGENRSGKSNMIHALRLVLDATLSYSDRQLARDDFWSGLSDGSDDWDPMARGEIIEVSVDITEFDEDPALVTALADALLTEEPMKARLTYRFAPVDTGEVASSSSQKYRGHVYGGERFEAPLTGELRSYLHLVFLHALRNVESDIRNWRRSPLRELLEAAAAEVPDADLDSVRTAMREANQKLNGLEQVRELSASITARLIDMVGDYQAVESELAVAPDDPLRLIRNMRIYVDGDARRDLASASLGTLNVLYLALLELGLQARLLNSDIAHVVMAIEEPEAHLHPHLQRLIFRRLLSDGTKEQTSIVTTQSPHIASVADPRSLVVLRTDGGRTSACVAHTADLAPADWDDISRYLDATRAELVFARKVLLVEGYAEQVMIPSLARVLGIDVDKQGISVCAVHGTHFESYVRFCDAIGIPWAILTDGDPDGNSRVIGKERAERIRDHLGLVGNLVDHGFFVGETTFEYDVLRADPNNESICYSVLSSLCAAPSQRTISSWVSSSPPDKDSFIGMLKNAGGKGRYAQRLALVDLVAPSYVKSTLEYLAD